MRAFIALNFNEELKAALESAIKQLQSQAESGRFTRRENLHLTLAFLGETTKVDSICRCLNQLSAKPFELYLGSAGRFSRAGGDLYWIGIQKNPQLSLLYRDLTAALIREGFSVEAGEFRPHITIGREIKAKEPVISLPPVQMRVERVSLMKSERIQGKLVYTPVYERFLTAEKE